MNRDRFWVRLLLVGLLALTVRVAYIGVAKWDDEVEYSDALYYAAQAQVIGQPTWVKAGTDAGPDELVARTWFRHPVHPREAADHAPLTALSQAPTAAVFGTSILAQRLVQAVYGTIAVVVIALLARRVAAGHRHRDRIALTAGVIAALYPNLWANDAVIMAETTTTLLVAGLLWSVYAYIDRPGLGRAALVGALAGIASLARAELALIGVLAFLPFVLGRGADSRRSGGRGRDPARTAMRRTPRSQQHPTDPSGRSARVPSAGVPWPTRLARLGIAGVAGLVVLAPWTIYNAGRFEEPVLLSTNDGLTLVGANCDEQYDGPDPGLWDIACLPPGSFSDDQARDQSVVNVEYRRAAIDYARANLGDLPRVAAIRVARTWSLYDPSSMIRYGRNEGREPLVGWAGFVSFWVLVPFAVAGTVLLSRRGRPVWPLLSTVVVVTLISALFYGLLRFRVPAEVALVVLAAVAVEDLWSRRTARV